jgi:hypothetical protein
LDRFDEALSELRLSAKLTTEAAVQRREPSSALGRSAPLLDFVRHYTVAKIAHQRKRWDEALSSLDQAAMVTTIARLPRYAESLELVRIDVRLQRDQATDADVAHAIASGLREDMHNPSVVGWSDCVELARACDAARQRADNCVGQLHRCLDILEERAHQAPLEIDRAFARLADAAREVDRAIAVRAHERSLFYRACRRAAAKAAWGDTTSQR